MQAAAPEAENDNEEENLGFRAGAEEDGSDDWSPYLDREADGESYVVYDTMDYNGKFMTDYASGKHSEYT